MAKTTRRTTRKAAPTGTHGAKRPAKKPPVVETPGARLARLKAGWASAFEALVSSRIAFLALCEDVSAAHAAGSGVARLEARRDRAEEAWRAAERAESEAAAAVLAVWTGGAGDADVLRDESEVDVDPAAALAFWKRVDWDSYCRWAGSRLAERSDAAVL